MKTSDSIFHQCLYFSSNALARKVEKLAIESWKPIGLSPSHAYLLTTILKQPGQHPSALSDELQLAPSTITRLIEKLEAKRLVVRMTSGKLTYVHPTQTAKNLQPQIDNCLNNFYKAYSSILGEIESQKLVQQMVAIADKLPV